MKFTFSDDTRFGVFLLKFLIETFSIFSTFVNFG